MEMRLEVLDIAQLPEGECKFIAELLNQDLIYGVTSFNAEASVSAMYSESLSYLNNYSDIVVARVGSGGRFDGGGVGDQEFLVMTSACVDENGIGDEELNTLLKNLNTSVTEGLQLNSNSTAEHKDLSKDDRSLLFHCSREKHPYPGRVLESEFVAGNRSLLFDAKRRVLMAVSNEKKKVIKKMKEELRGYRKCNETGVMEFKGSSELQFGKTESGAEFVAYGDDYKVHGFKYAYLRFFQLCLSIKIFQLMVDKNIPIDEFVELPSGVEERIRFLLRKEWVKDVDLLIDCGLYYARLSDMQVCLKAQYYKQEPNNRRIVYLPLKSGSLLSMQKAANRFYLQDTKKYKSKRTSFIM